MNRVISWVQNFLLHQVVVICLIGATFFLGQCFLYSGAMIAQADVRTPEGIYYKGTPDGQDIGNNNQVRNAQDKLKETVDNVRDKLNLTEETPRATKEFKANVERKAKAAVEPITNRDRGYYQQPEAQRELRR